MRKTKFSALLKSVALATLLSVTIGPLLRAAGVTIVIHGYQLTDATDALGVTQMRDAIANRVAEGGHATTYVVELRENASGDGAVFNDIRRDAGPSLVDGRNERAEIIISVKWEPVSNDRWITARMLASCEPPKIATKSLDDGLVEKSYRSQIVIDGGTSPLIRSVINGGLPGSLMLDEMTWGISGTPGDDDAGVYDLIVEICDSCASNSSCETRRVTLLIRPIPVVKLASRVVIENRGILHSLDLSPPPNVPEPLNLRWLKESPLGTTFLAFSRPRKLFEPRRRRNQEQ